MCGPPSVRWFLVCVVVWYKCKVTTATSNASYIGLTANPFKTRYGQHRHSFTNEALKHSTSLSSHIWKLNEQNMDYQLSWSILCKARSYPGGGNQCDLCTMEAKHILFDRDKLLNKRDELVTSCRHRWPKSFRHFKEAT